MRELLEQIPAMLAAFGLVLAAVLPLYGALRWWNPAPSARITLPRPWRPDAIEVMAGVALGIAVLPTLVRETVTQFHIFERWNIANEIERSRLLSLVDRTLWITLMLAWIVTRGGWNWQAFRARVLRDVQSGMAGFIVLAPAVFLIHFTAGIVHIALGGDVERHPLTQLDTGSTFDAAIVAVSACVVAPLFEELLFRGLLLNWCRARVQRAWIVFAAAAWLLVQQRGLSFLPAPLLLVDLLVLMAAATYLRQAWKRWPTRSACGVIGVAALFAVLHAAVWPTPWPLFAFALGLGALTLRTGTLLPAVIAHALFNAVTVVVLLRA